MARLGMFALAFLALSTAASAQAITEIKLLSSAQLNIDLCVTLINTTQASTGGFGGIRGTGFCPTNKAILSFLGQLGCKGSCAKNPTAFITSNTQLLPFIQRVFSFHQLAGPAVIFGSEFDLITKTAPAAVFNTSLVDVPGTPAAQLSIGLRNINSLSLSGITNLVSPLDGGNKATSTYLNAAINKIPAGAGVGGTPVAVIHAINKVLIPPNTYYTTKKALAAFSNKKVTTAFPGITFAKFLSKWVNAAPKASGFDVATTAISLFASTDAAWNTLATTGLGPITSLEVITKGSNAKNQQQALLKYAVTPNSNWASKVPSSFGGGLSWSNTFGGVKLGLLGPAYSTSLTNTNITLSAPGQDLLVQGSANPNATATTRGLTLFAGASTIFVLPTVPLVPSSTGV